MYADGKKIAVMDIVEAVQKPLLISMRGMTLEYEPINGGYVVRGLDGYGNPLIDSIGFTFAGGAFKLKRRQCIDFKRRPSVGVLEGCGFTLMQPGTVTWVGDAQSYLLRRLTSYEGRGFYRNIAVVRTPNCYWASLIDEVGSTQPRFNIAFAGKAGTREALTRLGLNV